MSFKSPSLRLPSLSEKDEAELRSILEPFWIEHPEITGSQMGEALRFGEGKYFKLNPKTSVYHYRQKWKLPKRTEHYKKGKQTGDMTTSEFFDRLDDMPPILNKYGRRLVERERTRRCFLIVLFWSGLRKSEVYELPTQKFEVYKEGLRIIAKRKKKIEETILPILLPGKMRGIEEVTSYIEEFKENQFPFNISSVTAWTYAKQFSDLLYPHYFRLNRITRLADRVDMTITKLKSWTGLNVITLELYLGAPERVQRKTALKIAEEEEKENE